MLIDPDFAQATELLRKGTIALSQVEANGIKVDVPRLDLSLDRMRKKIARNEETLKSDKVWKEWKRVIGEGAKIGARDQLGRVLHHLNIADLPKSEETGRIVTSEEVLAPIDHPFVRTWAETEKMKKLANTYLAGIKRELINGYLHSVFSLNTTVTFRSSSELVNFQNLPIRDPKSGKIIRSCFIPRKGRVLVEIDYSGIEVRIAACYNRDPVLIDYICDSSKDMHRDMAAKIFLCEIEQVNKMLRYFSKNQFVFPEFYGSYYVDCARNIWAMIGKHHLSVEEAPLFEWLAYHGIKKLGACDPDARSRKGTFERHIEEVEKEFWEVFNVYASWKKKWYQSYLQHGAMATLFGFLIQGILKRNEAINYPIQSSAFHCLLWSLIELSKSLKARRMRSLIVGQIHDSIVADVPVEELDDFVALAHHIMTHRIKRGRDWLVVPLEVEAEACGVGESWHHKKPLAIAL